jgi:peptide/nickel transport system substrate-binding protein
MGRSRLILAIAAVVGLLVAACGPTGGGPQPTATPASPAADTPRAGGTLTYVVASEPPSYDGHKETSYALLHPIAPFYSLLYRLDPTDPQLAKIIPDLAAEMPQISADKLTWTIKLRTNVKFVDPQTGATETLTSDDVKATYDRITNPPAGVTSARRAVYSEIESVQAPDPTTVVFKLKYPSGSLQNKLAAPWNFIYSAAKLKTDPKFPEKNVYGTGPFIFVEHVKGSHVLGKKNPNYHVQGRPYLDGFRAAFITDPTAQVNAIRGAQALIEFRGFTPQQRDQLKSAMGDQLMVQENSWVCALYVTPNTKAKPFDDVRVRRALTLAVDRWKGSEALQKITIVKDVGGIMRPGSSFATPEAELVKLAGYSKDGAASKAEAKRLLAEAGVPNLSFTLLNRNTPTPYEPVALFLIDEWKQAGITVNHEVRTTAEWLERARAGNYQVNLDFNCNELDEPDIQLAKFYSSSGLGKGLNLGGYDDKNLDDMIAAQSKETDPAKRLTLLREIEKYAVDTMAWQTPTIWWYRIIPHSAKVKGWYIGSNHYTNQDLVNIWIAP